MDLIVYDSINHMKNILFLLIAASLNPLVSCEKDRAQENENQSKPAPQERSDGLKGQGPMDDGKEK